MFQQMRKNSLIPTGATFGLAMEVCFLTVHFVIWLIGTVLWVFWKCVVHIWEHFMEGEIYLQSMRV